MFHGTELLVQIGGHASGVSFVDGLRQYTTKCWRPSGAIHLKNNRVEEILSSLPGPKVSLALHLAVIGAQARPFRILWEASYWYLH